MESLQQCSDSKGQSARDGITGLVFNTGSLGSEHSFPTLVEGHKASWHCAIANYPNRHPYFPATVVSLVDVVVKEGEVVLLEAELHASGEVDRTGARYQVCLISDGSVVDVPYRTSLPEPPRRLEVVASGNTDKH